MRAALKFFTAVLGALVALLIVTPAANATAPVDVGTKQIDDIAGVGADTDAASSALAELQQTQNVRLYVVLVDTFDGLGKSEWTQQSFTKSDLGGRDILLAIATDEGRYGGHAGGSVPLSATEIGAIVAGDPSALMSKGDFSGAIVSVAQGLQSALGETGAPGTSSDSGNGWIWFLVIVVIIAAGVIGFLWYRKRKRKKTAEAEAKKNAGPPPEPYEQLSDRSVAALIDTDNAVRSSDSELELAESEFGAEATADFRGAHNAAKQYLTKAFQLRQEIDDDIPESEEIRRGWMEQILSLCHQAMEGLAAQTDKFAKLRNIQARLPEVLAALPTSIDTQAARLPQAAATLDRLAGAYSASALSTIAGNTDQANERLEFARSSLAEAHQALSGERNDGGTDGGTDGGSGDGNTGSGSADGGSGDDEGTREGTAVLAARAAQEAVKQSTTLLDAIGRLEADLAASAAKLSTARDHVVEELADTRAALAQRSAGSAADEIRERLDAIERTVHDSGSGDAVRDPVTSLKKLNDADLELDEILADTRTAQKQQQRARASLDNELMTARSTISAVDDFVSTRRGAMETTARTRLAEAHRHLDQANDLANTDAKAALSEARRATDLARQAYQEAMDDMDRWGGYGYRRGGMMGGMGGGLLGGIMIGSLLGGGFRGGWGGGGGFGGGGFGGGGFGGGFGGGGDFGGSF